MITTAYRRTGTKSKEDKAGAFAAQWQPVVATRSKVVLVEDVPNDIGPAVECDQRVNLDVNKDESKITQDSAYKVKDASSMAASKVTNTVGVSNIKYFCVRDECPAVIGNVIVYRDNTSHITAPYSQTLGPYLAEDITWAAANLKGYKTG